LVGSIDRKKGLHEHIVIHDAADDQGLIVEFSAPEVQLSVGKTGEFRLDQWGPQFFGNAGCKDLGPFRTDYSHRAPLLESI